MNAWLFQDHRQKAKLGDACPWSVGWVDPEGKRRSKKIGSHSQAEKFARKTEGQLAAGVYETKSRKTWDEFRTEFEEKILPGLKPTSKIEVLNALGNFERIIKPAKLGAIKTTTIDEFIAKRRQEKGRKPGSVVSPYTIKKEFNHPPSR